MAEINPNTPAAAPAAAPAPPEIPATAPLSVPASAIFDDNEVAIPGTPPTVDQPAVDADKAAADAKAKADADAKAAEAAKGAAAAPAAGSEADKAAADAKAKADADAKAVEAAKAAAAAPAAKVKVGGKEYTVEELEKALAKPAAAAPAAAPTVPEVKPPTAEEIAVQETEWCDKFLKDSKLGVSFSKEDVEAILEGGDNAAKILSDRVTAALAKTVLMTRKSMYADLNPYFDQANAAMKPILEQQMQLERIATEQVFVKTYPEFSDALDTPRQVAEALIAQYPQETAKMSREQFLKEVAAQSDRILQTDYKRFNPTATDTWKDALKKSKAAGAAAVPGVTPPAGAQPAAAAAPAAQPAAAAAAPAPVVKPPAANSPAAVAAAGPGDDWHKKTAASLVD